MMLPVAPPGDTGADRAGGGGGGAGGRGADRALRLSETQENATDCEGKCQCVKVAPRQPRARRQIKTLVMIAGGGAPSLGRKTHLSTGRDARDSRRG